MTTTLLKHLKRFPKLQDFARDVYAGIPYHLAPERAFTPLSVVLNLTYRCNLRCVMCYHHREEIYEQANATYRARMNEELTTGEWLRFIEDAAAMGVKVLCFHGGEPTLRKDFVELSGRARELGVITSVISNGTFIDDRRAPALVENIDDLGLSLFGPERIHDEATAIPGSFQRLERGVARLQEFSQARSRGPLVLSTYILISSLNQDFLEEAFDIACAWGFKKIGFGNLVFTDEASVAATQAMTSLPDAPSFIGDTRLPENLLEVNPETVARALSSIEKKAAARGVNTNLTGLRDAEKILQYHTNIAFSLADQCRYPWAVSVITPYGEVAPCIPFSFLGKNLGNIREKPFPEIWRDAPYREFRKQLRTNGLFPICTKCCQIR